MRIRQKRTGTMAMLYGYQDQLRPFRAQRALVVELERKAGFSPRRGSGGGGRKEGRPTEANLDRLEQERQRLIHMETILVLRRIMVERYLDGVEDPVVRLAMEGRFVEGMSWGQVAMKLGSGAAECSVRIMVSRYVSAHPVG